MDVRRCSDMCLGVRDRLVLLLKCHHPMCMCPEHGDVPILTIMVEKIQPHEKN